MAETVRLTTTAKAAGCAAKLSPSILENVLKRLPQQHDPNVLVGFETSDDAAVYKLSNDLALVQTVDFFTAIVDEPDLFGQVAATNALSDVFAMGGRPISALTIVAFPTTQPPEVLEAVLRGGLAKMIEANCTVVGGHSIRDEEIKFGYAVTGPDRSAQNLAQRGRAPRRHADPHQAARHWRDRNRVEAGEGRARMGRGFHRFDDAPQSRRR